MVYQMLPYAVLPAYAAFSSIDLRLVSAAESLGASRVRALASVVVPLAMPGLFATATVVYVICTGFYLTPVILGGMSTPFAATLIHQNVFVFYNLEGAALLAVALILAAVAVVLAGVAIVGTRRLKSVLG
jgi:putative spermidine/putrescine transport system permease protein